MGVRVLYDHQDRLAVLYDSVSMTALAPVFMEDGAYDADEAAELFIAWTEVEDVRKLDAKELMSLYNLFAKELAERGWDEVYEEVMPS